MIQSWSWRRRSTAILRAAIGWREVKSQRWEIISTLFALDHCHPPSKKLKNPPKPLPRRQSCFPSLHRSCIHLLRPCQLRQLCRFHYFKQILKILSLTQISQLLKTKIQEWEERAKCGHSKREDIKISRELALRSSKNNVWQLLRARWAMLLNCDQSNSSVIHQVERGIKWKNYDHLSKV